MFTGEWSEVEYTEVAVIFSPQLDPAIRVGRGGSGRFRRFWNRHRWNRNRHANTGGPVRAGPDWDFGNRNRGIRFTRFSGFSGLNGLSGSCGLAVHTGCHGSSGFYHISCGFVDLWYTSIKVGRHRLQLYGLQSTSRRLVFLFLFLVYFYL